MANRRNTEIRPSIACARANLRCLSIYFFSTSSFRSRIKSDINYVRNLIEKLPAKEALKLKEKKMEKTGTKIVQKNSRSAIILTKRH